MKTEIKNRIEQIKRGEVPQGYKKTKVGVVPEEWEIKYLSDVLEKQTKKNADNSIHNVLTNSATQGIISQTSYFDKQIANDENTNGYYVVESGYFVYNPRISVSAPCGPFNKYYGDEKGIMSPLYTVYKYCGKSPYYSEFLSFYYSSSNWYKYMNSIANYGARSDRMNVTSDDMNLMPLPYPPLEEQEKIAEILACQDKMIELNRRKVEELKKLKKAYLSRMFPKKGSNVPELRFKGFTAPWKQCKLGEVVDFYNGDRSSRYPTKNDIVAEGIPFINAGDLVDGRVKLDTANKITEKKFNELSGAKIKRGDIIYCLRGTLGKNAYVDNFDMGTIASSLVDIRPKDINGKYLFHILNSDIEYRQRVISDEGAAQPNLSAKNLSEFIIHVPSAEEQNKVERLFSNLDNLITLHQRKVEELQNEKKALMQLLLTGIVRV